MPTLYPYQQTAVTWLRETAGAFGAALLADDMGCIDGEAVVTVNRAGAGRKMQLRDLFHRFHGGLSRGQVAPWRADIPTRIRSLCGSHIRLHEVRNVLDKGVRPVLRLETETGKVIRLTPDHEVAVGLGVFARADDLHVGDVVLTNGIATCSSCAAVGVEVAGAAAKYPGICRSCMYRHARAKPTWKGGRSIDHDGYVRISGHHGHPRSSRHGQVYEHLLVMEARIGRVVERGEHVHHINGDKADNRPENLELLTASEHARAHGAERKFLHLDGSQRGDREVIFLPRVDRVHSLRPDGEARVFDVVCDDPHRNFVANGIILHNCGKTPPALVAPPPGAPLLLVVPAALKAQTAERVVTWRGDAAQLLDGVKSFRMPRHGEVLIANPELLPATTSEVAHAEAAVAAAAANTSLDLRVREDGEAAERRLERLAARGRVARADIAPGTWVVVDECHEFGNNKSAQTKRLRSILRAVRTRGGRVVGLTATPLVNDPSELAGLLTTLGLGGRAWPSASSRSLNWFSFCDAWGGVEGAHGIEWTGRLRTDRIDAALCRVMLRRLFRDAVRDVPPLRAPETILLDLPSEAARLADHAEARIRERMEDLRESGDKIAFELVSRVRAAIGVAKTRAVHEWCDSMEAAGEPARVWCVSRDSVADVGRRAGWARIDGGVDAAARHEVLKRLAAGELRGIAGTIAAGGVGTDEQAIAEVLFASREWNPARNRQALARSYRAGQRRAVRPWFLRVNHPIEDRLDELLAGRRVWMQAIDAAAVSA